MKRFKLYPDNKLIIRIKNKNILNEKILNNIKDNKLLICCYNEEHNILFYENGIVVKDLVDNIFVEFSFDDVEGIYRKIIYECFIYGNHKKIKIENDKKHKFHIEFSDEV